MQPFCTFDATVCAEVIEGWEQGPVDKPAWPIQNLEHLNISMIRNTSNDRNQAWENVFNVNLDFLVWFHPLTWRRRGLWPVLLARHQKAIEMLLLHLLHQRECKTFYIPDSRA